MCTECGNVIPKLADTPTNQTTASEPAPIDFEIESSSQASQFGIDVAYTPPPPDQSQSPAYPAGYPPYDYRGPQQPGTKIVCERCGTVLRSDDKQCPGCGKSYQTADSPYPAPYSPSPQPYSPSQPYTPQRPPQPPPQTRPGLQEKPGSKFAKCAKCGAIVYDYETRCNNCGRILSPSTRQKKDAVKEIGRAPPGTARCSKCNAIVYPHQTVCPNCSKPLAPVSSASPARGPSQRISRCKRCSHTVYPTDTRCPNCGRKLDSQG
ncbi:MAG: zinc ribbon domain-containing protein [Candidatus Heimdallarchaeota archaeon]